MRINPISDKKTNGDFPLRAKEYRNNSFGTGSFDNGSSSPGINPMPSPNNRFRDIPGHVSDHTD